MLRRLAVLLVALPAAAGAEGFAPSLSAGLAVPVLDAGGREEPYHPRTPLFVLSAPLERDGFRLTPELGLGSSAGFIDTSSVRLGLGGAWVSALGEDGSFAAGPRAAITRRSESFGEGARAWEETLWDWHLGATLGAELRLAPALAFGAGLNLGVTSLADWPTSLRIDDDGLPAGRKGPGGREAYLSGEALVSLRWTP